MCILRFVYADCLLVTSGLLRFFNNANFCFLRLDLYITLTSMSKCRGSKCHRKYSFDLLFWTIKWDLRVLTSSAKSINRELSFVVRAQFWCGRTKEFATLVNNIFPMLLAAWSRQQYPCTWVKLSFIVPISQSDKKEEHSRFTSIDRFFILMESDRFRWVLRGHTISADR